MTVNIYYDKDCPETLDETVALIEQAGGRAVVVRVDHSREEDVANLAARVRSEAGRLPIVRYSDSTPRDSYETERDALASHRDRAPSERWPLESQR